MIICKLFTVNEQGKLLCFVQTPGVRGFPRAKGNATRAKGRVKSRKGLHSSPPRPLQQPQLVARPLDTILLPEVLSLTISLGQCGDVSYRE